MATKPNKPTSLAQSLNASPMAPRQGLSGGMANPRGGRYTLIGPAPGVMLKPPTALTFGQRLAALQAIKKARG